MPAGIWPWATGRKGMGSWEEAGCAEKKRLSLAIKMGKILEKGKKDVWSLDREQKRFPAWRG